MSGHTPGPWVVVPQGDGAWEVVTCADRGIACFVESREEPDAESNARLVAAAPDMYSILQQIDDDPWEHGCAYDIRALLARIDGREGSDCHSIRGDA